MKKEEAALQPGAATTVAEATTLKSSNKSATKPKGWKKWTRRLSRVFKGKKKNKRKTPQLNNPARSPDQFHKTHKHSDESTDESPTGSEKDVERRSTDSREWRRDQGGITRYSAKSCSVREPTDEEWEAEQRRLNGPADYDDEENDEGEFDEDEYDEEMAEQEDGGDQYEEQLDQEEFAEDVYEYEEHELTVAGIKDQSLEPGELDDTEPNQIDDEQDDVADEEEETGCLEPLAIVDDRHDCALDEYHAEDGLGTPTIPSQGFECGRPSSRTEEDPEQTVDGEDIALEASLDVRRTPSCSMSYAVETTLGGEVFENDQSGEQTEEVIYDYNDTLEQSQEGDDLHTQSQIEVLSYMGAKLSQSSSIALPEQTESSSCGDFDNVDGYNRTASLLKFIPHHLTIVHDLVLWCSYPEAPQTTDIRLLLACVQHQKWTLAQLLAEKLHLDMRHNSSSSRGATFSSASAETLLESIMRHCTA